MDRFKGYNASQVTRNNYVGNERTFVASGTAVATNERNENLRKLFGTIEEKYTNNRRSISYTNLPTAVTTILPKKGQTNSSNWQMANEARIEQADNNYANMQETVTVTDTETDIETEIGTKLSAAVVKTPTMRRRHTGGSSIRRWNVEKYGNEMKAKSKNVPEETSLASHRSWMHNIYNDFNNTNNNNYHIDDDIVSTAAKAFDEPEVDYETGTDVEYVADFDVHDTKNHSYCSYELATLNFDNRHPSAGKWFGGKKILPTTAPTNSASVGTLVNRKVVGKQVNMFNHLIGKQQVATATYNGGNFENDMMTATAEYWQDGYMSKHDQCSVQKNRNCALNCVGEQDQLNTDVNCKSELMKIRLERQSGKPTECKYAQKQEDFSKIDGAKINVTLQQQQNTHKVTEKNLEECMNSHQVGSEQLLENINLNTQLHSADIWRRTDEINGKMYIGDTFHQHSVVSAGIADIGLSNDTFVNRELENERYSK